MMLSPLLVCVIFAFSSQLVAGQATSGSSCSAVLQAGVYNTWSSTSSDTSFSQLQSALCQSYSSYTYSTYQNDYAAVNSGGSSASYCNSQAHSFDIAANGAGRGMSGGGSLGMTDSSSKCAASSSNFLTASQFQQGMTNINAYQQSSCGSSNNLQSSSGSVQTLQNIIDPQVYAAYTSCLKLFQAGIQYTQTSSYDSSTLVVDLVYVSLVGTGNQVATLSGVNTTGQVSCQLLGPGVSASASFSLKANLTANIEYSIICRLTAASPLNGNFSDIFIMTSPGGTYHGLLFNGVPKTTLLQVSTLQAQVAQQAADLSALKAAVALPPVPPGTILLSATPTAPRGYLTCDGATISRATFAALFSAIGTVYGPGDGSSTFNLPDLRGRSPVGYGTGGADSTGRALGGRNLGEKFGFEFMPLNVGNLPSHTHGVSDAGHQHGIDGTSGGEVLQGKILPRNADPVNGVRPGLLAGKDCTGSSYVAGGSNTFSPYICGVSPVCRAATSNINILSTGDGSPHYNVAPALGVNFIIKT